MEQKESNQMSVISNIKQWRKEMRVCHALSLFAIEENKRHTAKFIQGGGVIFLFFTLIFGDTFLTINISKLCSR